MYRSGHYSTLNKRWQRQHGNNDRSPKDDYNYGSSAAGGSSNRRQEKIFTNHSLSRGFDKKPNAQWDYTDFTVHVAKADERNIAAGLEKMILERRLIASYNWEENSWFPTIVVPGAPKVFHPWPGGLLEMANEMMTIDEESYRIPNAPMEPLFTAVHLCKPDFKLNDVDVVADLNCLKKLLRFVLRAAFTSATDEEEADMSAKMNDLYRNMFAGANKDCDFRIDAQVLGETVILMRRESEHRGRAMGFGVGYQSACNKPYEGDPKAAGPHKRITFVNFGGYRLLLRHKTLAAIYPDTSQNGNAILTTNGASGDGSVWPSTMPYSAVRYIRGGYLGKHEELKQIEFASVSKIKTRLVVDKWLDMLFIGSDHLYLGEHSHGRFDQPTMRNRADCLELSGVQPSDGRRILVILQQLLKEIIRFARNSAVRVRERREFGNGDGAGNSRQRPNAAEPFSFTMVSEDECRKLLLYKHDAADRRLDTTKLDCVSPGMMAALLEKTGDQSMA